MGAAAAHAWGEQAVGYGTGVARWSRLKPQNSSGMRPSENSAASIIPVYDVAKLAAVNPSTVSRALNNPERVSTKTRRLVETAAVELSYQVSPMARALLTGHTSTVGLIGATEVLKFVNIDLSFLSGGTWNISRGLMAPSMDKIEVQRAVLKVSSSTFLLADSTTFGAVSLFNVAPLQRLEGVITDHQLPQDVQNNIRKLGVTVSLATFDEAGPKSNPVGEYSS